MQSPGKRPITPASVKMSRLLSTIDTSPPCAKMIDRRCETMERCKSHQQSRILLQLAAGQPIQNTDLKEALTDEEMLDLKEAVFKRNMSVSHPKLILFNDNEWNNNSIKCPKQCKLQFTDQQIRIQESLFLRNLKRLNKSMPKLQVACHEGDTGRNLIQNDERLLMRKSMGQTAASFMTASKRTLQMIAPFSRPNTLNLLLNPAATEQSNKSRGGQQNIKTKTQNIFKVNSKTPHFKPSSKASFNEKVPSDLGCNNSDGVSDIQIATLGLNTPVKQKLRVTNSEIVHHSFHIDNEQTPASVRPIVKGFNPNLESVQEGKEREDEYSLEEKSEAGFLGLPSSQVVNPSLISLTGPNPVRASLKTANDFRGTNSSGKKAVKLITQTFQHFPPSASKLKPKVTLEVILSNIEMPGPF